MWDCYETTSRQRDNAAMSRGFLHCAGVMLCGVICRLGRLR